MVYHPAIDGMRAISVLAVIAFHCRVPFLMGGYFGVDVFFVISGYLITTILQKEFDESKRIDLGRFYWNRLVRLTPPLYLMLLVVLLLGLEGPFKTLVAAAYLSDFFAPYENYYGVLRHTWSLAVEEQFYLMWPIILIGLLRLPRPLMVMLAVLVIATAWRIYLLNVLPGEWIYHRLDTRLTGLVVGTIVALAKPKFKDASLLSRAAYLAVGIVCLSAVNSKIYSDLSLTVIQPLVEISAAIILIAALDGRTAVSKWLAHPTLVKIGLMSYAIYLWHYPIAYVLRQSYAWLPTFTITLALSLILAALTRRLVELPLRSLRVGHRVAVS